MCHGVADSWEPARGALRADGVKRLASRCRSAARLPMAENDPKATVTLNPFDAHLRGSRGSLTCAQPHTLTLHRRKKTLASPQAHPQAHEDGREASGAYPEEVLPGARTGPRPPKVRALNGRDTRACAQDRIVLSLAEGTRLAPDRTVGQVPPLAPPWMAAINVCTTNALPHVRHAGHPRVHRIRDEDLLPG